VTLEGWDHVPHGYGAWFDVTSAPWWLRLWFATPFLDRYAYPRLVRRGLGWLSPSPAVPDGEREPVAGGWRLRPPGYRPPGSTAGLSADGGIEEPGRGC
jgi:hypothetical protein